MKITNVRIFPINKGNLIAGVSIELDDFVVTGLKIIEGKNGMFVSMPSRKLDDGKYKDIAFPKTKNAHALLTKTVLDAFANFENRNTEPPDVF